MNEETKVYYVTYYAPERETEKAIFDAHWHAWLPKSQIHLAENADGNTLMIIPAWLKVQVAGRSDYAYGKKVWTPINRRDFPKDVRKAS